MKLSDSNKIEKWIWALPYNAEDLYEDHDMESCDETTK